MSSSNVRFNDSDAACKAKTEGCERAVEVSGERASDLPPVFPTDQVCFNITMRVHCLYVTMHACDPRVSKHQRRASGVLM